MKDETGNRYGGLTVLRRSGTDKHHRITWLCHCACCGETVVMTGFSLRVQGSTSCGCQGGKARNEAGNHYGRLTVLKEAGRTKQGMVLWQCRCECGRKTITTGSALRQGLTKSCGCLAQEIREDLHRRRRTHGLRRTPEYNAWAGARRRCYSLTDRSYKHYGGRGIEMCKRWRYDFEAFLKDVGLRPSAKHSIDRIDNDGNYEPENCRWATRQEQGRNKRSNRLLTIDGETQPMIVWAKRYALRMDTLWNRLKRGWSFERAVKTPV